MSKKGEPPSETPQSETSLSGTSPSETSATDTLSSEFTNIQYPGQHDVKLGRGGDANAHVGNVKFRQLINQYKSRYIAAPRSNKPFVAEEVVQIWRNLDPPGRFLIRTDPSLGDDSLWHDVGGKKARKKASQALREKDRSDDLVASLAHHHGGIPGAALGVTAASAAAASATLAAAAATANDDNNRKRSLVELQPQQANSMANNHDNNRRVAARQDVSMIDPLAAVRALNLLVNATPRPAVDPLLFHALQLLTATNQQNQQNNVQSFARSANIQNQQSSLQTLVQDRLVAARIVENLGMRVGSQSSQQQHQRPNRL